MDELPLLELDIPLDFQLYSEDDPAREVTPLPFDDLPVLGDEPSTFAMPAEAVPAAWAPPVIEPAGAAPTLPAVPTFAEAAPAEQPAAPAAETPSWVGSQSAPQPITQTIPIEALPRNVLGGGLAALDNSDMLASIEKRLAALRAATGIGPGGVELKSAEPVTAVLEQTEIPAVAAEPMMVAEQTVAEVLPAITEAESVAPAVAVSEPVVFEEPVLEHTAAVIEQPGSDLSALPFESVTLEQAEPTQVVEPTFGDRAAVLGGVPSDVVMDSVAETPALPAVRVEAPVQAELPVPPVQEAAVAAPLVAASPADSAGKSVAVVGESVLIESLYQMIMPRMKAELSLWLQDAIKMQSEQLLEGIMRQFKTDYDMMFGETLRESLRQAVADISRASHKEEG
ncbi:hypothetical protein QU487_17655 [Crenobacter sp. SG2305]|uniref:hypothetical protein n=1 Tax=Crenobacter oryzisoli TaxID=3056844 RepID=UPI0025AADDDF|nr:hypothetical protein [Crenobacter sp. SG2305]MDN0084564.1 hypothetical protein [Crenobacter sp. SG2305]